MCTYQHETTAEQNLKEMQFKKKENRRKKTFLKNMESD